MHTHFAGPFLRRALFFFRHRIQRSHVNGHADCYDQENQPDPPQADGKNRSYANADPKQGDGPPFYLGRSGMVVTIIQYVFTKVPVVDQPLVVTFGAPGKTIGRQKQEWDRGQQGNKNTEKTQSETG